MKKHICIIDNSDWYRSLESARLKITSPSGKSIWIKKIRFTKAGSEFDEFKIMVWKLGEGFRELKKIELTTDQMSQLLALSKI